VLQEPGATGRPTAVRYPKTPGPRRRVPTAAGSLTPAPVLQCRKVGKAPGSGPQAVETFEPEETRGHHAHQTRRATGLRASPARRTATGRDVAAKAGEKCDAASYFVTGRARPPASDNRRGRHVDYTARR
jgi:hypothetical protein